MLSGLDSSQLLTQTGVQSFTLIPKPPQTPVKEQKRNEAISPSTAMTQPKVNGLNLNHENHESDVDQKAFSEEEKDFMCFCIPVGNKKNKNDMKNRF